jgi:hypothetical protein
LFGARRWGPLAYHALTYGWLLAGIARQVTGRGMAATTPIGDARLFRLTGLALDAAKSTTH